MAVRIAEPANDLAGFYFSHNEVPLPRRDDAVVGSVALHPTRSCEAILTPTALGLFVSPEHLKRSISICPFSHDFSLGGGLKAYKIIIK